MKINKNEFKNADAILFDLGGVILNIDYSKTAEKFINLGLKNFDELYSQAKQSGLFDDLETGKIKESDFINKLLSISPKDTSKNDIIDAWNSMLLDLPKENLDFLKNINEKKRSFLFSNTNEIHLKAFNLIMKIQHDLNGIESFFEKCYFSHIFNHRKPDKEGFMIICNENNIIPEKLIFIDDSIQHVESAKDLGINAFLFGKNDKITDFIDLT